MLKIDFNVIRVIKVITVTKVIKVIKVITVIKVTGLTLLEIQILEMLFKKDTAKVQKSFFNPTITQSIFLKDSYE